DPPAEVAGVGRARQSAGPAKAQPGPPTGGTLPAERRPSTMSHLEENLAALGAHAPTRASVIASATPLGAVVEASRSGEPPLFADGVLLHSRDHPAREAKLWAGRQRAQLEVEEIETAVVLGFGLGYHVEALAAVW